VSAPDRAAAGTQRQAAGGGCERHGALLDIDEAVHWAAALRSAGKRLVVTNGVFDLLHAGHTGYLAAGTTRSETEGKARRYRRSRWSAATAERSG